MTPTTTETKAEIATWIVENTDAYPALADIDQTQTKKALVADIERVIAECEDGECETCDDEVDCPSEPEADGEVPEAAAPAETTGGAFNDMAAPPPVLDAVGLPNLFAARVRPIDEVRRR